VRYEAQLALDASAASGFYSQVFSISSILYVSV
jgi:hypothetical protein